VATLEQRLAALEAKERMPSVGDSDVGNVGPGLRFLTDDDLDALVALCERAAARDPGGFTAGDPSDLRELEAIASRTMERLPTGAEGDQARASLRAMVTIASHSREDQFDPVAFEVATRALNSRHDIAPGDYGHEYLVILRRLEAEY